MNWLLQDRLRLIRQKPFQLFLGHVFLTVAGGGLAYVLIVWHAFTESDSLQTVAINAIMFWGPSVFLGPVVGWLVDRYNRKSVLIITNLLRALAFIGIGAVLANHSAIYWCYILTFINGISFAFALPAFGAFTRELVEDKDLLLANTTIDTVFELANVLGMGLSGLFILTLSFHIGIIVVGSFIALGIFMLVVLKNSDLIPFKQDVCNHFIDDWKFAFNTLKGNSLMLWLSILNVILFVQFMVTPNLVTPFVRHVLHGGPQLFSLIEVACSTGMVLGAMALPPLVKAIGWEKCVFMTILGITLSLFIFSLNHMKSLAVAIYFVLGFCYTSWSLVISRTQELIPKAQQGRIQAILNSTSSLFVLVLFLILENSSKTTSIVHEYWYFTGFGLIALVVLTVATKGSFHKSAHT
jgi:DHA3 family macrolide efflux protein-like MFS transporter